MRRANGAARQQGRAVAALTDVQVGKRLVHAIEGREARKTARRVRQRLSAISTVAMATGRADADAAARVRTVMAPSGGGVGPPSPTPMRHGGAYKE